MENRTSPDSNKKYQFLFILPALLLIVAGFYLLSARLKHPADDTKAPGVKTVSQKVSSNANQTDTAIAPGDNSSILTLTSSASHSRVNQYIELSWMTENISYPVTLLLTSKNNAPVKVDFHGPKIQLIFPGRDEYLVNFFSKGDKTSFATVKVKIDDNGWEAQPVSGTAVYKIDESLKYYPTTKALTDRDTSNIFSVKIDTVKNTALFLYPATASL